MFIGLLLIVKVQKFSYIDNIHIRTYNKKISICDHYVHIYKYFKKIQYYTIGSLIILFEIFIDYSLVYGKCLFSQAIKCKQYNICV